MNDNDKTSYWQGYGPEVDVAVAISKADGEQREKRAEPETTACKQQVIRNFHCIRAALVRPIAVQPTQHRQKAERDCLQHSTPAREIQPVQPVVIDTLRLVIHAWKPMTTARYRDECTKP